MTSLHEMRPGSRPHEHLGKLAGGRQVLVTTRFGPVEREDGEHTQLTSVVFDAAGAVLSANWRVLGPSAALSAREVEEALSAALAALGPFISSPIEIQPVPVNLLGEPRPPLVLTSEEAPELSVTIANEGFFVPDYPFGSED